MMWGMHGPGAEVHEERLVGGDLLGVGDHRLGLGDEIGREVVALFRCLVRLGLAVVAYEFRVVLMRIPTEKPVVALESAAQRPAIVGASRRGLFGRREMPFAHSIAAAAVRAH